MRSDSPDICAERQATLVQELRAYGEIPADQRQTVPRRPRRPARRPGNAGIRTGPRPAPVVPPPDAVLEIRVVGNRLAVRVDRREVVVRNRDQLVAAVLGALPKHEQDQSRV